MRWHRNGQVEKKSARCANPKYRAAHWRVANDRGKASEHTCADCAESALHWSFAWRDCDPGDWRWGLVNGVWLAYTGNPMDYEPRCAKCARRYDSDFALMGWRRG